MAFLLCCNTTAHKRLQHLLFPPCNYTVQTPKAFTGLYKRFSCDLTHSNAHNTAATQDAYAPPAPRWSVSQRRSASSTYPDTTITPGRCTGQHSSTIIIRYIRVHHIADHASPAGSALAACGLLASDDTLPAAQTQRTF